MSKSNKNSSNKGSAPGVPAGATCVLCHTHVSPEDMVTLVCGMVPIAHESTVHVACAEEHAASEANSFLKTERLPVICRLLGGGGASPNLVSNSTLKALGLQDMLEATGTERRKGSLTSTKGKMSDKYLRMAKNWANDEELLGDAFVVRPSLAHFEIRFTHCAIDGHECILPFPARGGIEQLFEAVLPVFGLRNQVGRSPTSF